MRHQHITEAVLRRLLREDKEQEDRIQRRMTRAQQASMAAHAFREEGFGDAAHVAVIYDTRALMRHLEDLRMKNYDIIKDEVMLGIIAIVPPDFPCNDAWQIAQSAVKHRGDGGIIYDVAFAMSPTGKLIPDRYSVSPSAKDGWKQQRDRRSAPLDNVGAHVSAVNPTVKREHPFHTADPSDDCEVYDKENEWYLDRSYEARGHEAGILSHLKAEHDRVLQDLGKGVDSWLATSRKKNLIQALEDMSGPFFQTHYEPL